jgi:sulfopyruvate decarboxylase TPP-binding subunit|tara:strand:+ start:262 stop:750 length:489 start_codon:yes stop_codon:yes gene_type:complete
LDEKTQREIFLYLKKNKIENFVGVPDSTLKHFIDEGLNHKKILIANREEEAIGIGTGMILAGSSTLMFMQNAGFANSISTITSLVQLYEIPMLFLIGWRGYLKNDAPEHEKIGHIQPKLLKNLDLENKILTDKTWKKNCNWALSKIKKNIPVALIIRREFLD